MQISTNTFLSISLWSFLYWHSIEREAGPPLHYAYICVCKVLLWGLLCWILGVISTLKYKSLDPDPFFYPLIIYQSCIQHDKISINTRRNEYDPMVLIFLVFSYPNLGFNGKWVVS